VSASVVSFKMASKFCTRCELTKSTNEFNKSASTRDGFGYECKIFNSKRARQWQRDIRERYNEQKRNLLINNPNIKVSNNMHSRLNSILKRGAYTTRTEQIIRLSKVQYLEWLSFNFENEMC